MNLNFISKANISVTNKNDHPIPTTCLSSNMFTYYHLFHATRLPSCLYI